MKTDHFYYYPVIRYDNYIELPDELNISKIML
jgi:hypothetical protein